MCLQTIEAQMLENGDGGVSAVTVLPDSMAAQSMQMPMPNWECRGGCNCSAGAAGDAHGLRCEACLPGFSSIGGAEPCVACTPGTYALATAPECSDCPAGTFQRSSAMDSCDECPVSYECTGGSVEPANCQPGWGPLPNVTGCQPCVGNNYSEYGHCMPCLGDHIDHITCMACPANQAADPPELGCRCALGYVNTTSSPQCFKGDYGTREAVSICEPCMSMPCLTECHDSRLTIASGWGTFAAYEQTDVPIFKCGFGCPGGEISVGADDTTCVAGYEGVLCNNCAANYAVATDGSCTFCEQGASWKGITIFIVCCVLIGVLALQVKKYYTYFSLIILIVESDTKIIIKMIIAAGQIIAGLAGSLNVAMPGVFEGFTISFLSIFRFDLTPLLGLGCMSVGGTYVTSLVATFGIVAAAVLLCVIHWAVQRSKIHSDDAHDAEKQSELLCHMYDKIDVDGKGINVEEVRKMVMKMDPSQSEGVTKFFAEADTDGSGILDRSQFQAAFTKDNPDDAGLDLAHVIKQTQFAEVRQEAVGRLFLMIFLLYPALTAKIFEAFRCRELGDELDGAKVLLVDYTVDCNSAHYSIILSVASVLVLLWPIGVPAMLFYQLYKHKQLIQAEDEDTLKEFSFIIDDYKPEFYYWEVIGAFNCSPPTTIRL